MGCVLASREARARGSWTSSGSTWVHQALPRRGHYCQLPDISRWPEKGTPRWGARAAAVASSELPRRGYPGPLRSSSQGRPLRE
ncbi:Hypothetical predicted protein [Marmota monax]|uniref:Uncharacterized protein n=1 Tax=Marmota monax TaxID=9995 RepID=A0A5E4AW26_MARMO|nr:Hypothetical predicted protein [Marmota monax]